MPGLHWVDTHRKHMYVHPDTHTHTPRPLSFLGETSLRLPVLFLMLPRDTYRGRCHCPHWIGWHSRTSFYLCWALQSVPGPWPRARTNGLFSTPVMSEGSWFSGLCPWLEGNSSIKRISLLLSLLAFLVLSLPPLWNDHAACLVSEYYIFEGQMRKALTSCSGPVASI